jgi:hypothetical protein
MTNRPVAVIIGGGDGQSPDAYWCGGVLNRIQAEEKGRQLLASFSTIQGSSIFDTQVSLFHCISLSYYLISLYRPVARFLMTIRWERGLIPINVKPRSLPAQIVQCNHATHHPLQRLPVTRHQTVQPLLIPTRCIPSPRPYRRHQHRLLTQPSACPPTLLSHLPFIVLLPSLLLPQLAPILEV